MSKFKEADKTKIKNRFNKPTLISEVTDDGSIFFYEDQTHKTKLADRKQAKLDNIAAIKAAKPAKGKK